MIPYAVIKLAGAGGDFVLTNARGEFEFAVPDEKRQLTFDVIALGCKTTIHYQRNFANTEKIYVDITPLALKDFSIVGLSAEDVVKKR